MLWLLDAPGFLGFFDLSDMLEATQEQDARDTKTVSLDLQLV